ncbi:hypothetical protein ACH4L9_34795 [Streptomyces globisporus]|uniref:hypothetical protein n=1 Tax=Streptomyces globisporus TaxID=1908 RepID=UPI0037A9C49B
MSDTSTKAPPEPTTVVADSDGQHTPIEITLNQTPADDTSKDSGGKASRTPVRALPLALFGTEAAATGGAALYGAAGTIGLVTAAGVVAGGGVVAAAVAARRAARNSTLGGGRGSRGGGGGGGFGAGRGRGGGQRSALGSTGRSGSKTRSSATGPSGGRGQGRGGPAGRGGGVPSPRPGTGRGGVSLTKNHRPNTGTGQTRSGLRSSGLGGAGGGRAGAGASKGLGGRQNGSGGSGKGGLLRRLGLRRNGAGGNGAGGGTGGTGTPGKGNGKSRSTLAAAARRAGRAGMRGAAAAVKAGQAVAGSSAARSAGTKARAARRGVAKAANQARKRARVAFAAAAKKGKAGMRYLLRSAAAKVAAGAVGAIAMVPGLIGRSIAAATGGLLRLLRLAPRNGTKWGVRCTRWAAHVAKKVHTRLMAKAKDKWIADTRPDVLTDFHEPGHTTTPADPFGSDHFGGDCVSVFQTETEAVREAYAAYEPPMMLAVAAEYWGLTEGIASVGEAVRQLAVNTADKYPADKRMADQVAQVYALLHRAAEAAQEVGPLFAKVHEHDLRRLEEPRPGEHMWNILERRADGGYDQRQPSRLVAVTQDIAHVYARYEPGHMKQVAAEYEGVPAGIENIAATISLLQTRSNEVYPVDKAVVEALATVHQLLMQAASAAQELMPSFRRLHAPDIARHEDPRNGDQGEAMWDV